MISLRVVAHALVTLAGVWRTAAAQGTTTGACLKYEPAEVHLRGRVVFEKHFGPPNFGEDTLHDERVNAAIFVLASPVAVCGDTTADSPNADSFTDVTRLDFVVLKQGVDLASLRDKDIKVVGTLYQGPTGHYYYNVAINALEAQLPGGQVLNYREPPPKPLFDSASCLAVTPPSEVTTTRVGAFHLDGRLAELRKAYSSQTEKWMDEDAFMQSLQEGGAPELRRFEAISFKLPCARLSGSQFSASLDGKRAVSLWDVMGVGFVLPRRVPLSASWGDLQRAYGPGAHLRRLLGTPAICFDSLPGFEFILRSKKLFRTGWPIDSIPANATIWTVRIAPSGSAPHNFCSTPGASR